ncbi:MAG: carbohydrate binding family 9 domain-containing protein [Candidatus Delongbacteria bacterium]|nr:carbohydrate binding family 9 domain-containing protein [Candidatus Delongbacteria bacterium]
MLMASNRTIKGQRRQILRRVFWLRCLLTALLGAVPLQAAPSSDHRAEALRVDVGPRLDGQLNDAAWRDARWIEGLTQKDPEEGLPAGEPTRVAFVYDAHSLYIAAELFTPISGQLSTRMSPRDDMGQTQSFFISLDTYHDRRTAYTFGVTAAGVQVDFYHPRDEEFFQILTWDPVWEVRTSVEPDRWIVEARIPFSQLRFNPVDEQVWGLQLDRWSPERGTEDYWVWIPREETGWASRFGELHGIRGLTPSHRVELMPYAAGSALFPHSRDPLDPFHDSSELDGRIGADLKMGLGSNLTLDATINPDFGQVEADPAELNLTAFETFFNERRPFFLEGDRLLRGNGPTYYYSRRIGASPRGLISDPGVTHEDRPHNSSILGAAKLSGRLPSGLSIAVLGALSDRETSRTFRAADGVRGEQVVEPLSAYQVLRLQQDLEASASAFGLSLTHTGRWFEGETALQDLLPREAWSGGVDWDWNLRQGLYSLDGYWGFSQVSGSEDALARIQLRPAHYFQRPDADHIHYDPTRTSLSGWTSRLSFARVGGRHWRWNAGAAAESPGFELNDLGSLNSADDIDGWTELSWVQNESAGIFRRWNLNGSQYLGWNFGGEPQYHQLEGSFWGEFPSYWNMSVGLGRDLPTQSDSRTRGGESMGLGGRHRYWAEVHSDELRKPNSVAAGANGGWGADQYWTQEGWVFVRMRMGSRWELRLNPSVTRLLEPAQYVTRTTDSAGRSRTVFARLDSREQRLAFRVRHTVSPRLRVEAYLEPYIASASFTDFGEPVARGSQNLRRFQAEGLLEPGEDFAYTVSDPEGDFSFSRPDVRYASWRSNLVLRWDWRLGSSFYLVWQQNRETFASRRNPEDGLNLGNPLGVGGDNLIAMKFSYWIPVG